MNFISRTIDAVIRKRSNIGPVDVQVITYSPKELETNLKEWIDDNPSFTLFRQIVMIRNAYDLEIIDFEKAEEGRKKILQEISTSTSQF